MHARWTGDRLYYLLTESVPELMQRFPQYTQGALKGKKSYWRAKLKNGEIQMPPQPKPEQSPFGEILRLHNISPELAQEFTEQGFHVGYIKNAEGEIEYTIPLPHARGKSKSPLDFEPAQSAKISPSRRKAPERDHKRLYVFSDAQVDYRRMEDGKLEPIHDERALAVGRMICRDVMPDEIINLGDTVDLAALAHFAPDSDHFHRTLGPSFQRVHDYYAELRADNPWAKITEVDSNHNTRLKKFVLKYAPSFYNMKRAGSEEDEYPVFSYPFLANLRTVNVEWVSGYGAAEYIYGAEYKKPPIIFKHGVSVVSGGSTAAKESRENPDVHVVRGHSHRVENHYRTTRAGQYLGAYVIGAACRTTGEVPSYHSAVDDRGKVVKYQENWQQSVMVIYDYDGHYQFDNILINDGKAFYNGKAYEAEDDPQST
jgi:hypothetical protein